MSDYTELVNNFKARVERVSNTKMFTSDREDAFEELSSWAFNNSVKIISGMEAITTLERRLADAQDTLRHSQGRFLNINIGLTSGGSKREAIEIADIGEDCIKMYFDRHIEDIDNE